MSKSNGHILAIDDEPAILSFLQRNLQLANYTVHAADCGLEGLRQAKQVELDLILLDLNLPDMDGLDLLRQLRHYSSVPVVIISARDDEESLVTGLNLGADDYLVKPFSGRALQARIEAVLRRSRISAPLPDLVTYQHGALVVDTTAWRVTLNGKPVSLTPIEFALLVELIRIPKVRLHSDLLTAVWGPEYRDDVTVLRATIYRLRQKIEPDPANPTFIRTESGVGYRFVGQSSSSSALLPIHAQHNLPQHISNLAIYQDAA